MSYLEIKIEKPVWSMSRNGKWFVNLREDKLLKAQREGKMLKVSTMGVTMVCSPAEWLSKSDRREQFFKRTEPMVLRGSYVIPQTKKSLF